MELNEQFKIIPLVKDIICITCLSRGRELYTVEDLDMKNYCKGLQISLRDKVCWECRKTMSKFLMFTQKALKAQALFTQWIKDPKNKPLPVLSNLTTCSIYNLTCNKVPKAAVIKGNVVAKSEPGNGNFNIYPEINENDQYVEEDSSESTDQEEMESKVIVKIEFESQKEKGEMPDKNPPVKQSQAKELCAGVYSNHTILTSKLLKKEESSSQMINQEAVGETINTHEDSRPIDLLIIKELSHDEMLVARDKMRAEEKFKTSVFKCETCIEVFPRKNSLDKHNKKHSMDAGQYACSVCNQRFSDQVLLRFHEKLHLRQYKCPKCAETCLSAVSAQSHYEACIHKRPQAYTCKKCEKQFTARRNYMRHKRQNHVEVMICDYCGKQFNYNKTNFVKHLQTHSDNKTLFECTICNKEYRHKSALGAHNRKAHNNTRNKGAYCAQCDIQFKYLQYYNAHLKMSLKHVTKEDLKYPCPHCEQRFPTKSYLKRHTESKHSNELNNHCKKCDQSFQTRNRLRTHVRRAHDQYVRPKSNILCNLCGQTFTAKNSWKQHMNSHSGKRPYACETCGATFSYTSAYYTHKNRHKKCRAMLEEKKAKGDTNSDSNGEQTTA